MEFTSYDLGHLHGRSSVTKIRIFAHSDAYTESAQLERFRHTMQWHSPETSKTYIATMNKRQALKAVLDDEEAQVQDTANASVVYSRSIERTSPGKSPTEISSSSCKYEFD